MIGGALGGAAGGAAGAAMTGGDVGLGALAGGIGGAIGGAVGFKTLKWDLPGRVAAQVISGSVSGGIASVINGGNFWQGMAWGAAGAAIASGIGAMIEIATQTEDDHSVDRRLTKEERLKVDELKKEAIKRAEKAGDKEAVRAIKSLRIKGIFDAKDVEQIMKSENLSRNEAEAQSSSYIREWGKRGLLGRTLFKTYDGTVLSADFFARDYDPKGSTYSQIRTLFHEGWHAMTKSLAEEPAYEFAQEKMDKLFP